MKINKNLYFSYRGRAIRSIFISLAYYTLVGLFLFMLKDKITITGWDVFYVFIPIILLAISTETLKFDTITTKIVKVFAIVDLVSKIVCYAMFAFIIRHILIGGMYIFGLVVMGICVILSFVCSAVMIHKS